MREVAFPANICKFLTEEIMGAQNFKFAPKFPQNGEFLPLQLFI